MAKASSNRAPAQINRRQFIAAIPAVALPSCVPAFADAPSPVRVKFDEWKQLYAWANQPSDDEEVQRRTAALCEQEVALFAEPARDEEDLMLKVGVITAREFSLRCDGKDIEGLMLDVRRIFADRGESLPGV